MTNSSTNRTQRAPRPWFRVEAQAAVDAAAPAAADVYIYDEIGDSWWGGIAPKALIDEIAALDVESMTVHINSPGGAAWDGITIMNALRAHKATVNVVVDGLAASAASMIAMAGDTVTMNRGSQMMIHDASGGAYGNAQDLESTAAVLHKLSDSAADIYAARAGGTREDWRAVMQAETWYTAEEAVTAGLADAWDGSAEGDELAAVASFDLSRFRFQGRAHAPTPQLAALKPPSSSEPGEPIRKETVVAYDDLKAGLAKRLGVTDASASDEELLAALDETLNEQADPTPEPAAEPAPAAALPEGTVAIDATVLAQLQQNAQRGAEARAEQDKARRDGIVANALKTGRITAASKDDWRARLDKDETGFAEVLAGLPENTVPVDEIGHASAVVEDDAYPAHWKR